MPHRSKKKVIMLENGGGELANQLWAYVSVYAYAQERGYQLSNPSFYEYGSSFVVPRSALLDLILFKPFKNYRGRRSEMKPQLWRKAYKVAVKMTTAVFPTKIISSMNTENRTYYLPPSAEPTPELAALERSHKNIFMKGWLFRNPAGLEKYRNDIVEYFKPVPEVLATGAKFLKDIRKSYQHVIGVHIRQGDYKTFKGGKYWIEQVRIRGIINEFLAWSKIPANKACFVIASDGRIDHEEFEGLNIKTSAMGSIEDLFMLSKTDLILGSDSSFGNFAAFYGNIPHIIFKKEPLDWEYYADKAGFFENKYCTMVQY
jgi:hypothetical protein